MKTSIFDMNFVLPPMVEMTEVEKGMPQHTQPMYCGPAGTGLGPGRCLAGL